MKRPYFSITLIKEPAPCICIHIISPLDYTAMDCISFVIEESKKSDTSNPFPWDTAKIAILYQGMEKEESVFTVRLPNGRIATVENINPDHYDKMPMAIRAYVDIGERIKQDLIAGKSITNAAITAWVAANTSEHLKSANLYTPDLFVKEAMDWQFMLTEWGYLKS